ncbi:MAG TPA: serine O-acetyltransferase EpsC [Microbacteriaceae bacterium]|nr:serine O-acetyltransferase EpsC [Microbacteriaceae bacterium]
MSVLSRIREDIETAKRRDPAARSGTEILLGYSGLHAIWAYRLAHRWWKAPGMKLPARLLSQLTRSVTGVEIHPGARIGRRFFIDHGMGIVIGETAIVGDDVMLYHDVTLGGRGSRPGKRHPTLGDGVVVGAGAQLLGNITIGPRCQVGANAVVVRDAPADSVLVGIPARVLPRRVAGRDRQDHDPNEWIDPTFYVI